MTGPVFDPARLGPPPGARVAVVGGCGGMGRQLVQGLLDTGVAVAVLDLPSSLAQNPPPAQVLAIAMDGSDEASVAAAFGTLGQQSAQNANSFSLANDQSNLNWTENAQKYPMQWAQLGLNKYATDKGVAQTQMNLDAKSDSDNKSLIGMGLTLGAKAFDLI